MEGEYVRVPKIATGADGAASPATAATAASVSEEELSQLAALEIRVGRILSCERHPDADRCGGAGDWDEEGGAGWSSVGWAAEDGWEVGTWDGAERRAGAQRSWERSR